MKTCDQSVWFYDNFLPKHNSKSNPNPNSNPNQGVIYSGENCLDTLCINKLSWVMLYLQYIMWYVLCYYTEL